MRIDVTYVQGGKKRKKRQENEGRKEKEGKILRKLVLFSRRFTQIESSGWRWKEKRVGDERKGR